MLAKERSQKSLKRKARKERSNAIFGKKKKTTVCVIIRKRTCRDDHIHLIYSGQKKKGGRHVIFCLVEETEDLASNVLPASFLVVHDTGGGREDNVSELTGWEKVDGPFFQLAELDIVTGGDDTSLVDTIKKSVRFRGLRWDGCERTNAMITTYRPFKLMTILPERWSSTSTNSPM